MTQAIEKKLFRYALEKQQGRLHRLVRRARERGVFMVAVFEGWDAAGKGSALRRVTGALDARDYHVIPIAAPTGEERAHRASQSLRRVPLALGRTSCGRRSSTHQRARGLKR